MVLTFNRKMLSPNVEEPSGKEQTSDADDFYENTELEQEAINSYTGHILTNVTSLTVNLTNYLSDYDAVAGSPLYRTSEKESKGAVNLLNGKPKYYPATYTEATKEQIVQPEPDEPVDPPTDPQVNV